jgi:hypothetical protein
MAADFRRAARRTRGPRAANLSDLAAHYDAQAAATDSPFAGNKPAARGPAKILRPLGQGIAKLLAKKKEKPAEKRDPSGR